MGVQPSIPPLAGCLYCHSEGTTLLAAPRQFWRLGTSFPLVRCTQCQSIAQLDYDPENPEWWRIRYRQVNRDPRFYYVMHNLGGVGWLDAPAALEISRRGFVQRQRVQQTQRGDLAWLHPAPLDPPLPLMTPDELVYLTLSGVTFQQAPPTGFLVRADQGPVLDSGKFFVTGHNLHLLGQRRDWSHPLTHIEDVFYDARSWRVLVSSGDELLQYRGTNIANQWDAQLVAAIISALRLGANPA